MKLNFKIFIFIYILLNIQNIYASEKYTFGIGLGNCYGGLGTMVGTVSDNDMKYLSAGIQSHSSYDGTSYRIGIGWIKTDLITSTSNNHGIGLYIGSLGKEYYYLEKDVNMYGKYRNIYGYGLTYNYFFNGINKSGTHLGLSLIKSIDSYENNGFLSLDIGYQF